MAAQLEQCLAGIEFIDRANRGGDDVPPILGEFRTVREVGRGGMGVVYEAEQTSLRRRVALKVLRFGAVADEDALNRFQREAETVARLHHTNIVPIFAVGRERGVHYYAMQFIEGHSLADEAAEAIRAGKALDPRSAATWGLQAAEALAHAHQRGVIHRDIKPSNLLLDPDGVVWVTDFGLAKRADEVTLTVTGALMGTPRYMSLEQAEALKRPVDHRTDLYSLGASLFELATGRPAFEGATAHNVISQILTAEPPPPRSLRPALPRDLETIILTCLAKDPARRYATARALAEDLRAFLDGRPIKARRATVAERAVRALRRQRKSVALAAGAAAVAVATLVGGLGAAAWYRDAQLGRLSLTTQGPPLTAEIVSDDSNQTIGDPFTVPTKTPVALPAGPYRVRLSGDATISQDARLTVERGKTGTFQMGAGSDTLWEPIAWRDANLDPLLESAELQQHSDLIEWDLALRRRDGRTGKPVWELAFDAKSVPPGADAALWPSLRLSGRHLVRPLVDLDGDGTRDLVFVCGAAGPPPWSQTTTPGSTLLAVSGAAGRPLWWHRCGTDLGTPASLRVAGLPAVVDVDRDGTADFVAAVGAKDREDRWQHAFEAVSGRTGAQLWQHRPAGTGTKAIIRGNTPYVWSAAVVTIGERPRIVAVNGARVELLDPANGQPTTPPIDLIPLLHGSQTHLQAAPAGTPRCADIDGAGQPELIVVTLWFEPGAESGFELSAIPLAERRLLWTAPLAAHYRTLPSFGGIRSPIPLGSDWPLIADLDGDRKAELIVPDELALPRKGKSVGLRAIDGATGRTRWSRLLATGDIPQVERFAAGPDLDGDGVREVLAASYQPCRRAPLNEPEARLFVDALSGKDGHSLWYAWRPVNKFSEQVGPLRWWNRGDDGLPRLVVSVGSAADVSTYRVALSVADTPERPNPPVPYRTGVERADPRRLRPLPWAPEIANPGPDHWIFRRLPLYLAATGLLSAILLVGPALWLYRTVRRRTLRTAHLLRVPAWVGLAYVAYRAVPYLLPQDSAGTSFPPPAVLLAFILAGIPVALYVREAVRALASREWSRLLSLAALTVAASIVAGLLLLRADRRLMSPIEHYSWQHAYDLLWWGGYATGALLPVLAVLAALARLGRRWAWLGVSVIRGRTA